MNSDERDNTSVHSSFKDSRALISYSVDWADNASEQEKKAAKKTSAEVSKRLAEIVGKETGTYLNEASPYVTSPLSTMSQA